MDPCSQTEVVVVQVLVLEQQVWVQVLNLLFQD
jgi:hypothetical protein